MVWPNPPEYRVFINNGKGVSGKNIGTAGNTGSEDIHDLSELEGIAHWYLHTLGAENVSFKVVKLTRD